MKFGHRVWHNNKEFKIVLSSKDKKMSSDCILNAEKRKRPHEEIETEQPSNAKRFKESTISLLTLSDDVLLMIFAHLTSSSGINCQKGFLKKFCLANCKHVQSFAIFFSAKLWLQLGTNMQYNPNVL